MIPSILIAHPSRMVCFVLKRVLSPFYQVYICQQPWRSLAGIVESPPDLIVFDPLADNYALATLFREHFPEKAVKLLAIAPRTRAFEAKRAKYVGARYLACPFAVPTLLRLIRTLLREKQRSPRSVAAVPRTQFSLAYSA